MKKVLLLITLVLLFVSNVPGQTVQDVISKTASECPGIGRHVVTMDATHIGVTVEPSKYATAQDILYAVQKLLEDYAALLIISNYDGYIRIGLYEGGAIRTVWEANADETRAAIEGYGIRMDYLELIINNPKTIEYYSVDEFGRTDGTVNRLSPSNGNWLGG